MPHLLAVNGSYREGGAIDQAVEVAVEAALAAGMTVEVIHLRDFPIEFCLNCRHCTQMPGDSPGECVHEDGMGELVAKIEAADGFILASPTNFSSVTAVYKRFMERLIVYAYWPWGSRAPELRKNPVTKRAVLMASCAAPGLLGRLFFTTMKQLKITAKTIGAKPVGSVFIGLMSQEQEPKLPDHTHERIRKAVGKLV